MAACAYAFAGGQSTLVMARCKLPSIKTVTTMPKLEMNALTMATRLAWSVYEAMKQPGDDVPQPVHEIFIFSDSQIALSWLAQPPSKSNPGVLVSNRLAEIRRICDAFKRESVMVRFAYVNTKDNPADAGTRGLTSDQLRDHPWWSGPKFLHDPIAEWPTAFYGMDQNSSNETDQSININMAMLPPETGKDSWVNLQRFSSLTRAKRVTARALIFIKKLLRPLTEESRKRIHVTIPELSLVSDSPCNLQAEDIRAAGISLIRHHQQTYVGKDYRKSMENSLQLFMDSDGLWRSKGRLGNSDLDESAKYPIVVAPNTDLARLVTKEAHGLYHQGIEHTISTVRQKYWIPKIRQSVRKMIRKCVKCRRFNTSPYPYPDATDLPQRRVFRSRPFQHVGLDFFDLPSNTPSRWYGCIFTCTVTRLIHLEMVQSMSTIDFIDALRRFVARRGVPESITCDNAPTFLLTSTLLSNGVRTDEISADIQDALANKEIQWRHITPYAPWQGGFYERLIKSIKHALHKALRGAERGSAEHLRTILTEVEACLNSRPLTYQSAAQEDLTSVRPVDFLQKDLCLTLPLENIDRNSDPDEEYLPPEQLRALKTRTEVLDALKSSCEATEKYWKVWRELYLSSLREKHRKTLTNQRHANVLPTIGDVVLVCDPVLPRNEWRMARITQTKVGSDGAVREVELITSTRRKIRRPVNLLVPLEVTSEEDNSKGAEPRASAQTSHQEHRESPADPIEPRYNLRPRRTINTVASKKKTGLTPKPKTYSSKWFLFYIMLLSVMLPARSMAHADMQMTCTPSGVLIHTTKNQTVEVCTDTLCTLHMIGSNPFPVKLPPQVTLHDHVVTLKWDTGGQLAVMETTCNRKNFCDHLDCWMCAEALFNPECHPTAAITIIAAMLYGLVAFCYVLLYVPMTIGKPIRIICSIAGLLILKIVHTIRHIVYLLIRAVARCVRKNHTRSRRERLIAALAILMTVVVSHGHTCQHVNVLEHHLTTCSNNGTHETCRVTLSELLKINTYHREACLRLTKNTTLVANIKLHWKGLYLRCERSTEYFTRATKLKQISSKRCPLMGLCDDTKCEKINASTLIEDLKEGNAFPGRTGCMESCGGLGCGCILPSAGCLFYRIYAVPRNKKTYEIFECSRWAEEIKLNVTIENVGLSEGIRSYVIALIPNVPTTLPILTVTMTDISIPPMPSLANEFITDGKDVALWQNHIKPNLLCSTAEQARKLNCSFYDDCTCNAAENIAKCVCSDHDVEGEFQKIRNKLPIRTAAWEMSKRFDNLVTAKITDMVSADFMVEFNQTIEASTQVVTTGICEVSNSELEGCYHCSKGAQAKISCHSTVDTHGEILCDQRAFVVPCGPTPKESMLMFHLDSAQQFFNCSVRCGEVTRYFTLTGILKYTNDFNVVLKSILKGNKTNYHEFKLPDFAHIADVMLSWYKTLLCSLLVVLLALITSYLIVQNVGIRLAGFLLHSAFKLICLPFRFAIFLGSAIRNSRMRQRLHEKHL
uniref:Zinc finger and Integrase domain containing protein n=1 Tax=Haemonchus contortus TaxID=6289 RepID=W6NFA3_HAECO